MQMRLQITMQKCRMPRKPQRLFIPVLLWLAISALGGAAIARLDLDRLRDEFETKARIAHRLLSQRAIQHDAVLAMLALLQPAPDASQPEQRLPSIYPQITGVQRRDLDTVWVDERLTAAETVSRALKRPVLAVTDFASGRYQLVLDAEPTSFGLQLDLRAVVPWSEWPMAADTSPVRVTLEHDQQSYILQPGRLREGGWRFEFRQHLATDSQPFDIVGVRQVGWKELPWAWIAAWTVLVGVLMASGWALLRQRAEKQRAQALLRLGQVSRRNAMGGLAAGMTHELDQPLTALLANIQAASRLLAGEPPDLTITRKVMAQATEQARRAAEVVDRLRRAAQRIDETAQLVTVNLEDAVNNALYLLEPEFSRHEVTPRVNLQQASPRVQADPVALEQVIHNLLINALQALDRVPVPERQLTVQLGTDGERGILKISDTGPGIAADLLPRIFEPFYSTQEGGLGLGLNLCETLTASMAGRLEASHNAPRGAVFRLSLPLAKRLSKKP